MVEAVICDQILVKLRRKIRKLPTEVREKYDRDRRPMRPKTAPLIA